MRRWFDEVRLSRHPIEEIGVAFYIREMLGNDCVVNRWDLKDTFGERCDVYLENLRRSGMLVVENVGNMISLKVIAPGDKKRERCRAIVRKNRTKAMKGK